MKSPIRCITKDLSLVPRLLAVLLASALFNVAQALPADFVEDDLFTEQAKMIGLEFLPDGRMLAFRKTGEIHIFDPTKNPPLNRVDYMVISDVNSDDERGLLDIALDPDFDTNNYFYVYYVHKSSNKARVSRFEHDEKSGGTSSRGKLNSEQVIWSDNEQATGCCHYGGSINFGPDGKLYFIIGDKFDNDYSQDLTRSGGKIYRLNSDGSIPGDNPDLSSIDSNALPGIWAFGIRNPFRSTWDFPTGRLLMGEVGGNDQATATEDLHIGKKGANYGWPNCEAASCNPSRPPFPAPYDSYDPPLFSYDHSGVGAAIVGGFVYRGSMFPAAYQGAYFYGDYARGKIRYVTFNAAGTSVTGDFNFQNDAPKITSLKQGPDGALYYTRFSNGSKIRRIRYIGSGGNQPPVITNASADVTSGADPLDVEFTGSATDNENDALSYHWIFGDGSEEDGATVSHTYNGNGSYDAVLQVSDGTTTVASAPIRIDVGSPPVITSILPDDGTTFKAGDTIEFSATADDPDETLDDSAFSWEILFHHNDHFHTGPTHSGSNGSLFIETTGHDWNDNTRYEIIVDVTDSDGISATGSVFIYPVKVDMTLGTVPDGLTIYLDGIPKIAPVVYDTLIDFQHEISAPATQCVGTTGYTFDSWSDGGAAKHDIIVPNVDFTLEATFTAGGTCNGGDPGIVTPVSPSGTISENTPAYVWNADPNATRYKVRVDDSSGTSKVNAWYTAQEAGCGSGTGTCSVVTGYTLKEGDGAWKVKAANDSIKAPWSDVLSFTVDTSGGGGGGNGDPGTVTLVSPGGSITESSPAYVWNADPNATRYKLQVDDASGARKINTWYTADTAGCGSGTGTCSIAPSYQLATGAGSWRVKAANDSVKAPWSARMNFTVESGGGGGGGGGTPGVVTPISPSGNISDNRPDYTWSADAAATRYKLNVNDSSGSNRVLIWFTAAEAGCESGTGTCSIDPGYSLANGNGSWRVKAGTASEKGPWSALTSFNVQ